MNSRAFNLAGLAANLVGVFMLFRWGMPFHVPTGGKDYIYSSYNVPSDIALEHTYMAYGFVGLALLILGTVLQMAALFLRDRKSS
jgi:hypothetical protein